jgi:hypothetical protein
MVTSDQLPNNNSARKQNMLEVHQHIISEDKQIAQRPSAIPVSAVSRCRAVQP